MQLVKMELWGFKSFADKTTLTFDAGITAIVGPNGSGKSNISDAVRWVMGEQNVRQLRGQKAEDVIFSGTEKRRPQGAAEVSLYFDNSDHSLDIDFTEVAVTRRLFRSGESEFYINKRPCRLKDIHALFADTGVGQDSMAVIGQNRVDRILNSKPEERRIIFEEVAGISRFKGRKEEGLRKIAETERNLERIRDMMSMLEERMTPMQEQAGRLRDFRRLDSERISYEGTLTLQELRNTERLLAKVENSRQIVYGEQQETAASLAAAETQRQALLQSMERDSETMRRLDAASQTAHSELDDIKSRRDAFAQRRDALAERSSDMDREDSVLAKKETELAAQEQVAQELYDTWRREVAAAEKGLALTQALFGKAEDAARQAAARLTKATESQAKWQQQVFILRRDADELRRRLTENGKRCDEINQELAQRQNDRDSAVHQYEDAFRQEKKAAGEEKAAEQVVQKGRDALQAAAAARSQAEDAYRRLRSAADALAQRIRVLESMEKEHEGAGRAAKAVLDANAPWRTSICGLVGELCQIPADYAAALDIALGAASRYLVAETEAAAKQGISYLKERRAGRTTFLPLDTLKERRRTAEEERAAGEQGIIGFASALLTYDRIYDPVFSSLLGKTLVAESVEAASRVARAYGHRLRIVCLDGTQFHPGGSLTGGSVRTGEGSLISRRVLLTELKAKAQETQGRLEQAIQEGKEKRRCEDSLRASLQTWEDAARQARDQRQRFSWQVQAAEQAREQAEQAVQRLDGQAEQQQRLRADMQAALLKLEEDEAALAAAPSDDTRRLEDARRAALAEAEQCRTTLTERQIAVATLKEQVRQGQLTISRCGDAKAALAAEKTALISRRDELTQQQKETKDRWEEAVRNAAEKEAETKRKDTEKEAFYSQREDHFQKSRALDERIQALREREHACSQKIHAADVQLEKYRGQIARSEELLAMQGLTRQEAMERRREGSLKELQDTVASLKRQIAALGQINPNAEEEYQAAVTQRDFYHRQCLDMEESRTKLEGVVAEIDEAMETQFSRAFAEIGRHFQQIFSRLFGGGTASVELTSREDILHAGVEILIQPPGKKRQPLSLLSGGERALTVIALLLAFLAYHPAPFCLVDEVDAALDEANVERMARYLKTYSGSTQFIVITHRRKTMEAANTLQGVTMEERGVSRLLTVKVDELLAKRS